MGSEMCIRDSFEQAWIRRRATVRLVTLEEDCAELRKLSRAYELVEAALPEENRTAAWSEWPS